MSHRSSSFLRTALWTVCGLLLLAGCAPKYAYYKEWVPAQADVDGIESIAIAEFDGLQRSGRIISAKLSQGVVDEGYFRLLERQELDRILDERDFNQSEYVDPATVSELKLLGVDALVFGVVDAYSVDTQTGVTKIEREVGTGRYREVEREGKGGEKETIREEITETILIDRGYVLREGTMAVTFKMANINTGEIVAIKAETAHFSEQAWEDEDENLPTKDEVLDQLAGTVAGRFLGQIHPGWVSRRVDFEKNEHPDTELGVNFAQAGLWDKAYDALRRARREMPGDPTTHYNVAVVAEILGHDQVAEAAIDQAISIEPREKYLRWLAWYRQSEAGYAR